MHKLVIPLLSSAQSVLSIKNLRKKIVHEKLSLASNVIRSWKTKELPTVRLTCKQALFRYQDETRAGIQLKNQSRPTAAASD
ncbi:MAG: hypothetical protein HY298_05395 [Verrucomicrobia bacterium]|nr:hypothetical protein [Verrucomicrobiota bacterium]